MVTILRILKTVILLNPQKRMWTNFDETTIEIIHVPY